MKGDPCGGSRAAAVDVLERIRSYCGRTCPLAPWESVALGQFRPSAVLLPLFVEEGGLSTLFTARPQHLRRHPGQIGFPGGAREGADLSPVDTALREAREELGLPESSVEVLGVMPPEVAFTSDFLVFPVIGWLYPSNVASRLSPDPQEVDRLIQKPLVEFSSTPVFEWRREGALSFVYPVFPLEEEDRIWGVTARILLRFVKLLQQLELL